MINYIDVINNKKLEIYMKKGNDLLGVLGFTDHSSEHTAKVACNAAKILTDFGHDERTVELSKIAGYMHDIGNVVNRAQHSLTGATLAFQILSEMDMEPSEIADIISAIGNHDEGVGEPVNTIAAAIIIADKSDVRRSRVRNENNLTFDIHDRVNYAVEKTEIETNVEKKEITLKLSIDVSICPVIDYFEIFLTRMIMCKKAAEFLQAKFKLIINGAEIL